MRNRNLLIGAMFLALLGALGAAQKALEQKVAAQAKSAVQAPRFEVDPPLAEAAAEPLAHRFDHRGGSGCTGQHLDHSSPCDVEPE